MIACFVEHTNSYVCGNGSGDEASLWARHSRFDCFIGSVGGDGELL